MDTHPLQAGLQRFREAQDPIIGQVRDELSRGRKTTHWMWFVFPQIAGLGRSETARRYAIGSLDEASAFLADPVLGARLRELTALAIAAPASDAKSLFGEVDAMKFRSCMSLFDAVEPGKVFCAALSRFFDGIRDPATAAQLATG